MSSEGSNTYAGSFQLGTGRTEGSERAAPNLIGKNDGTLTWDGKNIVLADSNGNISAANSTSLPLNISFGSYATTGTGETAIKGKSNDKRIFINSGQTYQDGAYLVLTAKESTGEVPSGGKFQLTARGTEDTPCTLLGSP